MCRAVYIAIVVFISGVSAGDGEKCKKLLESDQKPITCCKEPPIKGDYKEKLEVMKVEAGIEKCMDESDEAEGKQCSDKQKCIAKNMGLTDDNGNEDKEAVKKSYEETFKDYLDSKVYEDIKKNCIDKAPKDSDWCYFKYMEYCSAVHFVIGCKEWEDDDSCNEVKKAVDECEKSM